MERNREVRRASMAAANGLSRRRHRNGSLRESPEEDGPVELQETVRLRDREKDRERERLSRSKRRRGDRLNHGNNREDGGDESTNESVNDEEDDEDDVGGGVVRMLPPNPVTAALYSSSSVMIPQHITRKNFSPVTAVSKVLRPAQPWKAADEMMSVSVPRKARSASTKRSHECWVSSGGGGGSGGSGVVGDQIHRQASTSSVRHSLVSATSPSHVSPSSSNISVRKKMNSNGSKHRPPLKSSSKSSSSNQDEIEIEIAEVLYGMLRLPQGPPKQEIMMINDSIKCDSREDNKTTAGDAKSRVSSPISISLSVELPQASLSHPHNSSSSTAPVPAFAPKRKRPRPVIYDEENSTGFATRNNSISSIIETEKDQSEKLATLSSNIEKNSESMVANGHFSNFQLEQASPESLPETVKSENRASLSDSKLLAEELAAALKYVEDNSPGDSSRHRFHENHVDSAETKSNLVTSMVEKKREEKFQIDLMASPFQTRSSPERAAEIDFSSNMKTELKHEIKEDENMTFKKLGRDEAEKNKVKGTEEIEPEKSKKEKYINMQLSLEKNENDSFSGNKLSQHASKQHQMQQKSKPAKDEQAKTEKTAQSSPTLPLPMSMPGWLGGLPPMSYMTTAPMQGVVSMDGTIPSSLPVLQTPHLLFSQPRPKRCASHCYIARNIHYHQQISKMTPFWPAPSGTAAMYGPKSGGMNSVQGKGQGLAMFNGHAVKEKSSLGANIVDITQRKQQQHVMLQQALPKGATPNNIMHGPAFLYPLSQPQDAVAASVRGGALKSPTVSNSAPVSTVSSATAMSFNYPNMLTNDSQQQYLAILQNGGYPFPIPAHVGGPPPHQAYRGPHPQAVPFFNGSFYSPQMLHPSQLQHLQTHQNSTVPSVPSSAPKHLQQQRPQSSIGVNNNGSAPKTKQQSQRLHQKEGAGSEDSPTTADSRVFRPNMNNNNVYGQNFPLPIHPQNFVLMAASSGNNNSSEKKQQQAFAMSFASGIDMSSSMAAQNHEILQNLPEAARQGYQQLMVAAHASQVAATQQKKIFRSAEECGNGKNGSGNNKDSSIVVEEERKPMSGKSHTVPGSNLVVDNSARGGNHGTAPAPARGSGAAMPQQQRLPQQQQQLIQLQKQQSHYVSTRNNKMAATPTSGNVFSDHMMQSSSPSSTAAKFSNVFPQNLVQSNASSQSQSPQWKNSSRTPLSSQASSPSMAAAGATTSSSIKNLSQQQQSRTQLYFTGNPKSSTGPPQPQQPTNISRAPSPPITVGSPPTSSISRGATESPRTVNPASTSNKSSQGSTLSQQQQGKSGLAAHRKSSPVETRAIPSHLGNSHSALSSGAGTTKAQLQQQQNQLAKKAMQQSQMLYYPQKMQQSSYMQNQAPNSSAAGAVSGTYYPQKQRPEHNHQPASSAGGSYDPAKTSAVGNMKGDGLPLQAGPTTVLVKPAEQKQSAGE